MITDIKIKCSNDQQRRADQLTHPGPSKFSLIIFYPCNINLFFIIFTKTEQEKFSYFRRIYETCPKCKSTQFLYFFFFFRTFLLQLQDIVRRICCLFFHVVAFPFYAGCMLFLLIELSHYLLRPLHDLLFHLLVGWTFCAALSAVLGRIMNVIFAISTFLRLFCYNRDLGIFGYIAEDTSTVYRRSSRTFPRFFAPTHRSQSKVFHSFACLIIIIVHPWPNSRHHLNTLVRIIHHRHKQLWFVQEFQSALLTIHRTHRTVILVFTIQFFFFYY